MTPELFFDWIVVFGVFGLILFLLTVMDYILPVLYMGAGVATLFIAQALLWLLIKTIEFVSKIL